MALLFLLPRSSLPLSSQSALPFHSRARIRVSHTTRSHLQSFQPDPATHSGQPLFQPRAASPYASPPSAIRTRSTPGSNRFTSDESGRPGISLSSHHRSRSTSQTLARARALLLLGRNQNRSEMESVQTPTTEIH